jgi:hypothetical protein
MRVLLILAAGLVAVAVFVVVWFEPQKLWIDDRVEEPAPAAASPERASDVGDTVAPPAEPQEIARGEFVSRDHHTSGLVRVLELGDGERVVRLEGLDTSNGPDLYVYLTAIPADGPEGAFDDEHANLGRLKGNQGDQNYGVPAEVDLDRLATLVIWCDRFDSAFGAADLIA